MGDEEVIGSDAYAYTDELLVEVTCRDADGHLVVHSYPCRFEDEDRVTPAEPVPDGHVEAVEEAVSAAGYRFVGNPRP